MQIFRVVAGYTYGKADVVRRAISKKKADVLEKERGNFVAGAIEKGADRAAAEALFEDMTDFANYGFKKSHAAAYAMLSYQSAYLKTHYTAYYYASLLSSVLGNLPKMSEYIAECAKLGIKTLRPDINCSRMSFVADAEGIRFGLLAIKNVGGNFLSRILRERENGPYDSFYDFVRRLSGGEMNKRAVEALIRAGAMDGLGANRAQLLACCEKLVDRFSSRDGMEGQMDLFGGEQIGFSYPDLPDLSMREKLHMEKEACGMCASGHLLDDYTAHLQALAPIGLSELAESVKQGGLHDGDAAVVCGIINSRTDKTTKNGDAMAFAVLEDRSASVELVIFPKVLPTVEPLLRVDVAVCASGRISVREEDEIKLLVDRMIPLIPSARFHPETYRSPFAAPSGAASASSPRPSYGSGSFSAQSRPPQYTKPLPAVPTAASAAPVPTGSLQERRGGTVYIKVPDMKGRQFRKAVNLCEIFDGESSVVFYDGSEKKYVRAHHLSLSATDFVLNELKMLLGTENIVWKEK